MSDLSLGSKMETLGRIRGGSTVGKGSGLAAAFLGGWTGGN
ncbi:hypothetical protein CCACVL1_03556 [Corchorus capsularis]|uniref:Uncharacterized protein n=1 Tax=Corchorus capsularis TaxID=210143 RepID=A0A1R3JYM1_COCAP|nr:hypothetical protein CCACVL1_03556 [Corchorus capsularis]